MGFIIFSVIVTIIGVVTFIVGLHKELLYTYFIGLFCMMGGCIYGFVVPANHKGIESIHLDEYCLCTALASNKNINFETACHVMERVSNINRKLKKAKKYNERPDWWYGMAKEREFASLPYIEYTWDSGDVE